MNAPPKEKRGLQTALETAELKVAYRVLCLLQAPFGFLFWKIERCKARLLDRIDNERSAR